MKFIIPLLFVSFLSSQTYEIKGAQIKYYGSHFLHDWIGVSNDLNGNVFIDNNNSKYQVDLNVPLISFSSNNSNRDSNMLIHTEAFIYPEVIFKSTNIVLNQTSAMVEGELLFHGITKKIKTSATIDIANGFVANGSFNINLKDFNIETPTLMLIKIDESIKIEYTIKKLKQ